MSLWGEMFEDREHAGKLLGEKLLQRGLPDPVILALPRGGVTVAAEVARILNAPLEVVISRKIGAPGHLEFGIGAMSEDEVPLFNPENLKYFNINGPEVKAIVDRERIELRRRIEQYREGRELPNLTGKSVIVIDDGLATGVTAAAAGAYLKKLEPGLLMFAAPVCPEDISLMVTDNFDEIVCLERPSYFQSVGQWYREFDQVEDDEVMSALNRQRYHLRKESEQRGWPASGDHS